MTPKILICAATQAEARAVSDGISLGGGEGFFEILRTGMGSEKAARALSERLSDTNLPKPSLVISTGFAGSERTSIALGSWILGQEVGSADGLSRLKLPDTPLSKLLEQAGLEAAPARIRLASDVIQVESAMDSAPEAVDMESYALALVCQAKEIPFAVFRLISDTPDAPLPRAIGAFARVATASRLREKATSALSGLSQTLARPRELGRFLVRGAQLSGVLKEGWHALARARIDAE